jgi:hypothetical protein
MIRKTALILIQTQSRINGWRDTYYSHTNIHVKVTYAKGFRVTVEINIICTDATKKPDLKIKFSDSFIEYYL